ncbi:zf-HC2 domain-containing protein [Anaeromyxobacter oryzae]|uniref:Putative zinc-finger domain-containing protein n=1 Tax=Anaeromyxobacter oryzae TaxID=2918170 RepID=A0ABN6MXJ7_9BACT|nr:zf-HC2 domain-containing protein [Anaeromyxobacter oryzae]BDG05702.1 hypothetical protein AMOR_46980 [Anaeromyxobacter oryzae]
MTTDLRCVTWDDLADWWAGDLAPSRADALEEHLLDCDACSRRAERVGDLARAVAALARSGAVAGPATSGLVSRLERDGVRVHRYRIGPGQVVPCSAWPEDQVMAAVLDVSALIGEPGSRFDLLARFGDEPVLRAEDVPLDRTTGTLTWLTPAAVERSRPVTQVSFQVVRVSGHGESIAGEYALAHEPWTGPASPR